MAEKAGSGQGVVYIITSLAMGGAQKVLLSLLAAEELARIGRPLCVITLREVNGLQTLLADTGIPVMGLTLNKPWLLPVQLWRLRCYLRAQPVSLVYSLLHHANLFAVLLNRWCGRRWPLIWSLHDTPLENLYTRLDHRLLFSLSTRWARLTTKIVVVSRCSRQRYIEVGYPAEKLQLIPNGVLVDQSDTIRQQQRRYKDYRSVRCEWGLAEDTVVVGSLTRYVTEKDIPCLLQAWALFLRDYTQRSGGRHYRLLLAGEGMDAQNQPLQTRLEQLGVTASVILAGGRNDAPRLINALDVATLSSLSEALPLFLAEAMSAGIPCAATQVGDIANLLGDCGQLVPPASPQQLAAAWWALLSLSATERAALGYAAQQRIASEFGMQQMIDKHSVLYIHALNNGALN